MNLEAYRSEATTVPWTMNVKPERIIEEIPLRAAVHNTLGRTLLMGGRGRYFDQNIVTALSADDWKTLNHEAHAADSYFNERSNVAPTDEDVRRVLSKVYHLWNRDDAIGAETRHALSRALDVLGVGKELSLEVVFPQLKNGRDRAQSSNLRG